jgi:hypothetical protein
MQRNIPSRFRNENPCHQSPDLAAQDGGAVEIQHGRVAWFECDDQENQGVEGDDIADQAGNGETAEGFFEAVEKGHGCGKISISNACL